MALIAGTRLGPYEVVSALGAGGMGEVYRARDTRLNRDVALKVLPEAFASDPERLARFRREAQVLAALNHPHIAAIYGLEEERGMTALVLELVEGPTLAERLASDTLSAARTLAVREAGTPAGSPPRTPARWGADGPPRTGAGLPVTEALAIARQIAEALEAAHEQSVIHRDLKPANIKVTPDGIVKVLDFGLAKLTQASDVGRVPRSGPAGGEEPIDPLVALTQSPTLTSPAMMTGIGVILGTAPYMAPEQAKGRPADKRSDVWAFGCVLYEMLTGKRAFEGEDLSDTLAAILMRDPDWSALPASVPPAIVTLLRRCLERDRRKRASDIAAALFALDEAAASGARGDGPAALDSARAGEAGHDGRGVPSWRRALPWALAGVLLATVLTLAAVHFRETPPESLPVQFAVTTPPPQGNPNHVAVSPDGRWLTFVGSDGNGTQRLWLRALNGLDARPLAGTEAGVFPFWSPDSRFIGFMASGKLKKIDVTGGPAQTLCDVAGFLGGTWSGEGVILFAAQTGLLRVPSSGGMPARVRDNDGGQNDFYPQFLPDGRHFLYLARGGERAGIYVGSLDSPERTFLVPASLKAEYAPQGYLLSMRESTLMAQPFDAQRLQFTGDPVPVAEGVSVGNLAGFSVSAAGVLAYRTRNEQQGSQLVWYTRSGQQASSTADVANGYSDIHLSPDGRRVAASLLDASGARDLWLFDLAHGQKTRFTFEPTNEGDGIWSPDGARIAFTSTRNGPADIYQKPASGAAAEELLLADGFDKRPVSWSPDGRYILFLKGRGTTFTPYSSVWELWVLPVEGDRKPFPFITSRFNDAAAQFSPDGRWVAYQSNESGPFDVFVVPFPGSGGRWQVSSGGGEQPRWRRDGREIFYRSPDGKLMAAAVDAQGTAFNVGTVRELFQLPALVSQRYSYDVTPDGSRFLVAAAGDQQAPLINVMVNWTATLKRP